MPIPPKDGVKLILSDFEVRIRRVVERAWQEWLALPDRGRFVFMRRMRAVFVFDCIARIAMQEFADDPNIHVIVKRQTVHFLFKDEVLVRFKLSNSNGVGSNIETQAVLDFIDPEGVIPGLVPEIMKVEVCYCPDDMGISLEEIAVVARNRTKRVWSYQIDGAEPAAPVIPIPPRGPDQTPPTIMPRQAPAKEDEQI